MKRSCKFLLACTVAALIFTLPLAYAQESGAGKILILYYSRTGNTRMACEALQKALNAQISRSKI